MRYAHPLTAEENAVELAVRKSTRSHEEQDRALLIFRRAQLKGQRDKSADLERVASAMLGKGA